MKTTQSIFLAELPRGSEVPTMSIAVHLHLFYIDLIPEFVAYLQNVEHRFDIYISVPEQIECCEENIRESFIQLKGVSKVIVERTPNKGRDIAPMICTFGKNLLTYDVVLHLHTKKSPHDASQNGWRLFMLEHLLGSKESVNGILVRLMKDLGIVCSADFLCNSTASGWCDDNNIIHAQRVIDRSSLNINLSQEYAKIDFPQGSMFWARMDYIRPLFEVGLSYDDFDNEPLPIDGTIAHAIERLFFVLGEKTSLNPAKVYSNLSEQCLQYYAQQQVMALLELKKKAKRRLKTKRMLTYVIIVLLMCLLLCLVTIYRLM